MGILKIVNKKALKIVTPLYNCLFANVAQKIVILGRVHFVAHL